MRRINIGIAGVSEEPEHSLLENIELFLDNISKLRAKPIFILGGYWGFMKYFADKALEKGYTVVFILPSQPPAMPPDRENSIAIYTDLGFPTRSTVLCKSSDVLVVFGGRIGSIIEIMLAYDFGKPVIVIESGYETDKITKCFGDYIDLRRRARLYSVRNGVEAVEKLASILEKPLHKYTM
ncbi:MAG: DNA transporter [Thermoprotei archaeon]|nr:MAG: DNA transporter [Thermoprotei archaeon]